MVRSITVFYDGGCPLCRREVAAYRRLDKAGIIQWRDAAAEALDPAVDGLSSAQALQRMHIRRADGSFATGAAAFAEIWQALPPFRPLAALARLPGALWVMERGYRTFLRVRPVLTGRRACP